MPPEAAQPFAPVSEVNRGSPYCLELSYFHYFDRVDCNRFSQSPTDIPRHSADRSGAISLERSDGDGEVSAAIHEPARAITAITEAQFLLLGRRLD